MEETKAQSGKSTYLMKERTLNKLYKANRDANMASADKQINKE
jgi:hypothetical protein